MRVIKKACQLASIFLLLSLSYVVVAEQSQDFANLQVHYIALPSTFLEASVAKQYGIKRSKYTALINISILDKNNNLKAVAGELTGIGKNLIGQNEVLKFKEIKEGMAIYYIAPYPFNNEELVHFTVDIKAQNKIHALKFKHTFYVD